MQALQALGLIIGIYIIQAAVVHPSNQRRSSNLAVEAVLQMQHVLCGCLSLKSNHYLLEID